MSITRFWDDFDNVFSRTWMPIALPRAGREGGSREGEDSSFWELTNADGARMLAPRIDVEESEEALSIKADVPGVDRNNISVKVENNVLVLRGERTEERKKEGSTWARYERSQGSFERRLALPDNVEGTKANAKYDNGVLCVTIPKKEPTEKHHTIQVE